MAEENKKRGRNPLEHPIFADRYIGNNLQQQSAIMEMLAWNIRILVYKTAEICKCQRIFNLSYNLTKSDE